MTLLGLGFATGNEQLSASSAPDGESPEEDVDGNLSYSSLESRTPMSASTTTNTPFPEGSG